MTQPETTQQEWKDPDWNEGGRTHNWRNHVPDAVQVIWGSFDDHQKFTLYRWAEDLANMEHWE